MEFVGQILGEMNNIRVTSSTFFDVDVEFVISCNLKDLNELDKLIANPVLSKLTVI